jgi:hypothetical protein
MEHGGCNNPIRPRLNLLFVPFFLSSWAPRALPGFFRLVVLTFYLINEFSSSPTNIQKKNSNHVRHGLEAAELVSTRGHLLR